MVAACCPAAGHFRLHGWMRRCARLVAFAIRPYLRLAIADVAAGAESLGEIDLAHLCRKFGLARRPDRADGQDTSRSLALLDAEWDLPDGEVVVLEVDGTTPP